MYLFAAQSRYIGAGIFARDRRSRPGHDYGLRRRRQTKLNGDGIVLSGKRSGFNGEARNENLHLVRTTPYSAKDSESLRGCKFHGRTRSSLAFEQPYLRPGNHRRLGIDHFDFDFGG